MVIYTKYTTLYRDEYIRYLTISSRNMTIYRRYISGIRLCMATKARLRQSVRDAILKELNFKPNILLKSLPNNLAEMVKTYTG